MTLRQRESAAPNARGGYDVIIVGAGLAGLFAGALAARRGLHTLVIARGVGGTHVGPGSIDVWGHGAAGRLADNPQSALRGLRRKQHPLALAGVAALRAAVAEFKTICEAGGYSFTGGLEHNLWLPTALGAVRPTCLAPESLAAGDVRRPGELTLARLSGFRDFYADLAVANLNTAGYAARAVTLELPHAPARRDAYATDLARLFDNANYRAEVANHWRPLLGGVTRLGLPAILGLENAAAARRDLSDRLGLEVFEIPILPPSVPGIRLFTLLRRAVEEAGGRVVLGPAVTGRIENGRATGIESETAAGWRPYAARAVILATGGFRHGGLEAPAPGAARETVFGLPVTVADDWFETMYTDAQPYAQFGLRVNARLQPLAESGRAAAANLYAIGGLLAGADRISEGSREGVDLATAYLAVTQLPLARPQTRNLATA